MIEDMQKRMFVKLKQLVVEECELDTNLKLLKNFFLLGKGEFWQSFIEESQDILTRPINTWTEYDLQQGVFVKAFHRCFAE